MKIRRNNNLAVLIALSLQTPIKEINVKDIKRINNETYIDIIRTMPISKMKMINKFYTINITNNTLQYRVTVNADNDITVKLHEMEKLKLYYLFDITSGYEEKLIAYNKQMTNNIQMYKNIILEALNDEDEEVQDKYVFYFIANDRSYIGFANDDIHNKHCIKSYDFTEPENAYKIIGNKVDAKVACIKRNYNSKYYGNWNYAKSGTNFTLLKY